MNREGIIITICIGIVVLFYLFRVDSSPVKEVGFMKKPTAQSVNDVIKEASKQIPNESLNGTPDSLDNKDNQSK